MDDFSKNIASNLLAYREKRNWSQMDLAKHIGIPRANVANLESGVANPSLANALKIAKAVGLSVEELSHKPKHASKVTKWKPGKNRLQKLPGNLENQWIELEKYKSTIISRKSPGTLCLMVIEGKAEITVNSEIFRLDKYQVLEVPHFLKAEILSRSSKLRALFTK